MAEDPIKLFSTRSERYPEPTDADAVLGAGRAALAAIPFLGGSITEVLSLVLAPAVSHRRDAWFKELAEGLDELQVKVEGFKIEDLQRNEVFVSAVIQATRIAVSTHKEEKRRYLRNALLNVARGSATGEDLQQMFLNAIDAFTPSHIQILNLIWRKDQLLEAAGFGPKPGQMHVNRDYRDVINLLVPELRNKDELQQVILLDLFARGYSLTSGPGALAGPGNQATNLGLQFLQFVLSDDELPR